MKRYSGRQTGLKRRAYKKNRIDIDSIRWPSVFTALGVLVLVVVGVVFGVRACAAKKTTLSVPVETPGVMKVLPDGDEIPLETNTPQPLGEVGASLDNPIDLSAGAEMIVSKENNVNIPDVFGHEMIYSAGTGSLRKPVLKTLYLYDFETGEEKEIAKVQVKEGEIFETVLNQNYIAWLDTDQRGSNRIYCIDRNDAEWKPKSVRECNFAVPKIRLSNDYLIWIEQNEEKQERLYVVDLIVEENASIPGFPESIEKDVATYGVSAPGIYDTQVVWAATDPEQSDEDRALNGEKSAIYTCDIDRFIEDDYAPTYFRPDMYVHDPITNGEAWAWIDRNKAPDSTLYMRVGDEVVKVAQGVITYALGDEMLVFGKNGNIYVYFYKTGQYGRVNKEGERSIMPVVSGRRIVWFDQSGSSDKDQLKTVVIPYEAKTEADDGQDG